MFLKACLEPGELGSDAVSQIRNHAGVNVLPKEFPEHLEISKELETYRIIEVLGHSAFTFISCASLIVLNSTLAIFCVQAQLDLAKKT